ncbi:MULTISPECIES: hypothetical protein [Bacillaceae]|uniref:General stress protein 17M-like domain-containing protein n=1 Tax=Evansella alkalicola TaxID=745819 RepID=A0ABS6JYD4_9BACI|nr:MULTISPECIES: hypothetical protein [Bacillaceae]MBU9723498.1 hypothetical protein [Bacillus alkalicola]
MEGKVIAVFNDFDEKQGILEDLKKNGYKDEDLAIVHESEEEAQFFNYYFGEGDYVVVELENSRHAGMDKADGRKKLRNLNWAPENHHHFPHHQMKQGM